MDSIKIIETSILKTSLNFQLLDFIEELIEKEDTEATNFLNRFFDTRKSFDYKDVAPLICLETTLGMMASVIFFAKSKNIKLSKKTKNLIKESSSDEEILRIIRNAIAHWSDDDHDNIKFTKNNIVFISRKKRITVNLPNGLHYFVMDIIRETRNSMKT